ncbi:unnamed protein product [Lota lota]
MYRYHGESDRQSDRQTDSQVYRQTDSQVDRQTDRQREIDRQTEKGKQIQTEDVFPAGGRIEGVFVFVKREEGCCLLGGAETDQSVQIAISFSTSPLHPLSTPTSEISFLSAQQRR